MYYADFLIFLYARKLRETAPSRCNAAPRQLGVDDWLLRSALTLSAYECAATSYD